MSAMQPILAGTSLLMTLGSGFAANESGNAAADYTTQLAARNAYIARENARLEAAQFRRRFELEQGQFRVNVAKSGVTLEGSPLEVLADNASQAYLQEQLILRQAEVEAQNQVISGELNAASQRNAGRQAMITSFGRAATFGTSLLADKATKAPEIE